ncbi:unnamed protein product [Fraxinus pennsylvanica]|uniref:Uncharacterized protein n=1 Tax=Fraxinus pennsylvanica TaxID=56036 RepID=A0AAD2ACN8_9LAMI|nr:unnamed protein product [Fraxinus pennsylvanica]
MKKIKNFQMEDSSSTGTTSQSNKPVSELAKLQKLHEEKISKIEGLKKQKEELKTLLEKKLTEETKPFDNLCDKYNNLRDEYNALLARGSEEKESRRSVLLVRHRFLQTAFVCTQWLILQFIPEAIPIFKMTDHRVFVFGSFTEEELRFLQCEPSQDNTEITFGSLDTATLRSVGISNTSLKEIYSPKGYELLKPARVENAKNVCSNDTCPVEGNISKELKPVCLNSDNSWGLSNQRSIQQPSCERVTELSSSLDDGVLDDSTEGFDIVDSNKSIAQASNGPYSIAKKFLPRGLINLGKSMLSQCNRPCPSLLFSIL